MPGVKQRITKIDYDQSEIQAQIEKNQAKIERMQETSLRKQLGMLSNALGSQSNLLKDFFNQYQKFYDNFSDAHKKEIGGIKELFNLNEKVHKENLKQIKQITDAKTKQIELTKENIRYSSISELGMGKVGDIADKEEKRQQSSMTGGMFNIHSFKDIFRTSFEALGVGSIAFSIRDSVRGFSKAADELREIRFKLTESLATIAAPQGAKSIETRMDVYQLGRRLAKGGVKEEVTYGVAGTLAQAGIPKEKLTDNIIKAVSLGFESGMGPEKAAQVFDKMYRELRVPADQLGSVFYNLRVTAKDLQVPFDQLYEHTSSVHNATKQYGYTLQSTINYVARFEKAIQGGIVSVQQLVEARQGITKTGLGERAFLGTELLEKLPENVRIAVEKLGGGPMAMGEAIKGALETSPIFDLTRPVEGGFEKLIEFTKEDTEKTRSAIYDYTVGMAEKIGGGGLGNVLYVFRDFAKTFLGMDLENLPLKTQEAMLTAFREGDMKSMEDAMDNANKKDKKDMKDAMAAGMKTALESVSVFNDIKEGITDVYRSVSDQIKIMTAGLFGGEVKEYEEMRRSLTTGRKITAFEQLLGGEERFKRIRAGEEKPIGFEEYKVLTRAALGVKDLEEIVSIGQRYLGTQGILQMTERESKQIQSILSTQGAMGESMQTSLRGTFGGMGAGMVINPGMNINKVEVNVQDEYDISNKIKKQFYDLVNNFSDEIDYQIKDIGKRK